MALAWALPDEISAYADAVLAVAERDGLRVPDLWLREIANGLAMAHVRKRMDNSDRKVFLEALSLLRIDVEPNSSPITAIQEGTAAAIRYGLTAYDAAYVDLAEREQLTLATLDTAMVKAAQASGVSIFAP